MQIYEVLKKDHQNIQLLLKQISQIEGLTETSSRKRADLLERLNTELTTHSRAEEKIFYDTLKQIEDAEEIAIESEEEHSTIESIMLELLSINPTDKHWFGKLAVLKENLDFHIEGEENEVFPLAKQLLAPEEAKMMAEAFKSLKDELTEGSLIEIALSKVAQFMPARFSRRFTEIGRRLTT
jgi:hemerythrin-like domain-containing protein